MQTETPIYSTQKEGHPQSVELMHDRLILRDRQHPLTPETLELHKIRRIDFVPINPGEDPRKVSLAIRIEDDPKPKIISSLELEEARHLKEMIEAQRRQLDQTAFNTSQKPNQEDLPFTYWDRVLKQLEKKPRSNQRSWLNKLRNRSKKPDLNFRNIFKLSLILPLVFFGQIELTSTPAPESALLINLPNVYLLPSSPFYPLKEFWDKFILLLTSTPQERAQILNHHAKTQLAEIVRMIQHGDLQRAGLILKKYQENLEKLRRYQNLLTDEHLQWLTSQLEQHAQYRQLLDNLLARRGITLTPK